MQSLFADLSAAEILDDPFPHIVAERPMAPALYSRFAADIPGFERVGWAGPPPNNKRYVYSTVQILADKRLDPSWRAFVRCHTAAAAFLQVVALFAGHWERLNPRFAARLKAKEELRVGLLGRDSYDVADVLMDARLEINTPVFDRPSSVRGGHLDTPNRLFSGLFYLRDPADDTQGGDLQLFRWRRPARRDLWRFEFPDEDLELAKTVRYAPNRLVLFPNSMEALHGVSERAVTAHQRSYMFVTAEVEEDLFGAGRI